MFKNDNQRKAAFANMRGLGDKISNSIVRLYPGSGNEFAEDPKKSDVEDIIDEVLRTNEEQKKKFDNLDKDINTIKKEASKEGYDIDKESTKIDRFTDMLQFQADKVLTEDAGHGSVEPEDNFDDKKEKEYSKDGPEILPDNPLDREGETQEYASLINQLRNPSIEKLYNVLPENERENLEFEQDIENTKDQFVPGPSLQEQVLLYEFGNSFENPYRDQESTRKKYTEDDIKKYLDKREIADRISNFESLIGEREAEKNLKMARTQELKDSSEVRRKKAEVDISKLKRQLAPENVAEEEEVEKLTSKVNKQNLEDSLDTHKLKIKKNEYEQKITENKLKNLDRDLVLTDKEREYNELVLKDKLENLKRERSILGKGYKAAKSILEGGAKIGLMAGLEFGGAFGATAGGAVANAIGGVGDLLDQGRDDNHPPELIKIFDPTTKKYKLIPYTRQPLRPAYPRIGPIGPAGTGVTQEDMQGMVESGGFYGKSIVPEEYNVGSLQAAKLLKPDKDIVNAWRMKAMPATVQYNQMGQPIKQVQPVMNLASALGGI